MGFEPQGHAAEFHIERALVHPIEVVSDHVADRLPQPFGRRPVLAGADASEFLAQVSGSSQQEMTGAAGGVEDAEGEKGMLSECAGE